MTYRVNEIFYSVQGEGRWTGRPAVFLRFADCNLWTGNEADRASAICRFCDTDFTGFAEYREPDDVVRAVTDLLPDNAWEVWKPMVVVTGGEPMLQFDEPLARALGSLMYVAVETNGTKPIPFYVDWVCVSPKTPTIRARGDELKLVYPQERVTPEMFAGLPGFQHYWLSPMDGPDVESNTRAAYEYVLAHPQWGLTLQSHKKIGVK